MVKGDDKLERLRSAPARAPCSRPPIPQHSESQHESEVSTAPRSCIPAFAHRPAVSALLTLAGSRTTASPSQSLLQGIPHTATDCEGARPSHTRCRTLSRRPHAHSFPPHTLGFFRHAPWVSITLSASQFSLSHTDPLTLKSLAHSQNHPGSVSLSRTHARTLPLARSLAARASFSHHRPRRAPRSRRPPLSRGVSPAPSAPRGFRPASSTRRRRPSRALDRTRDVPDRNGTSPGPNRSQPLTSSPPPVSSRCPGAARMLGRAAAAQAPPTPRHSHRIATARAAWGPGSERGPPGGVASGHQSSPVPYAILGPRRGPPRTVTRVRSPTPGMATPGLRTQSLEARGDAAAWSSRGSPHSVSFSAFVAGSIHTQ